MLKLKVNDESRNLKDEFIDVTLNELSDAYKFITSLDADTKRYLLTTTDAEIDQSKFFEFKIKWIARFSDFTTDELRLVPVEGDDSLSVDWLYDHCKLFLYQPKSYIELKEFEHKGIKYDIIKPLKTISGAKMLFGTANFRQFMLSSQLTSMVQGQKNEKGIESLKLLFALLYSDGKDSSEEVSERGKLFGEVNALYGWSAYFFFAQLVKKYSDFFHLSTTKNPPALIKKALAIQQLKQSLSKTIFGRLCQSKWLKQEFLILQT
jgi:hypothetical protein